LIKEYKKSDEVLIMINNSEIWFRSASDPEKLRGPNITWFYIDEASLVNHMVWKIMLGRVRQKGYKHKAWITKTPKGFNWVWKEFVEKQRDDYFTVTTNTLENIYLPEDYTQSLLDSYSGVFLRQEIYGEFVGMEGLVYQDFSRLTHVIDVNEVKKKFSRFFAGLDFGYTNPTACVICTEDSDGRIYIVDEIYKRKLTSEQLINLLKEKNEKYKLEKIMCDPSDPQLIDNLKMNDLLAIPADNEIVSGIMEVSKYIKIQDDGKPRLFVDKECINTIMEFESYCYSEEQEGKPVKDKPIKINDHALDALRYLIMSERKSKQILYFPISG